MITSLTGIALRFFRANKGLAISSIVSVALSVFLVITMMIFSGNAMHSLEHEMRKMVGEMEIAVAYEYGLSEQMIEQVTSIEGIERSSAVLIDQLYVDKLNTGVYTVGAENDTLAKSRYHFTNDLQTDEVHVSRDLAEALELEAGSLLTIEGHPYTVKEVIAWPDSSSMNVIILPREAVQTIVNEKTGERHEASFVMLKVSDRDRIPEIVQKVKAIDPSFEVDWVEADEFSKENIKSMRYFMIVLSGLALIVSALFILSNAETLTYKYRNQLAVMRSLGASRGKVSKVLWTQLGLINMIGAGAGFLFAWIGSELTQRWIANLFALEAVQQGFPFMNALLITLVSFVIIQAFMMIPAFRSMRIAPLKIVAQNEKIDFGRGRSGKWFGLILLGIALFLIAKGFIDQFEKGTGELYFLIGAFVTVLGLMRLFAHYIQSILSAISPLIKRIAGPTSFVAIQNIVPQVRKNTFIILTISVLMTISMVGGALFASIQHNEKQFLESEYETNILVKNRAGFETTIDPVELSEQVRGLTGIESVSTISYPVEMYIEQEGEWHSFSYRLGDTEQMIQQELLPSDISASGDGLIITREMAEQFRLKAGDEIALGVYSLSLQKIVPIQSVAVIGVHDQMSDYYDEAFADWSNPQFQSEYTVFDRLFIESSHVAETVEQLERLQQMYPFELSVSSFDEEMKQADEMFVQRWAIFIAVLVVILMSVMMGIMNAMANNIQSKRKEYALLRTLSVTGKGITKVIMTQVVLYVVLGVLFGVVSGALVTWIIGFIDLGNIVFDVKLTAIVSLALLVVSCVTFIPVARSLRKAHLPLELTHDNK